MGYVGTGKRVLFRTGENWSGSSKTINMPGPGHIGTFGTGARPVVSTNHAFTLSGGTPQISDWRFVGLEFTGGGDKIFEAENTLKNVLVLDCYFRNVGKAFEATQNIVDWYAANTSTPNSLHDGIAIVHSDAAGGNFGQLGMIASEHFLFMGNDWERPYSHTLRLMGVWGGVISHSRLAHASNGAVGTVELKMHAPDWTGSTLGHHTYTGVYLSDNMIDSTNSDWQVVMGPQTSGSTDERLRDIIYERNYHEAGSECQLMVKMSGVDTTIRNNVFNMTGGSYIAGVSISQRSIEPLPDNCRVNNNTFYRADSGDMDGVEVSGVASNTEVKNNLGSGLSGSQAFNGGGSGTSSAANILTSSPGWVSSNPNSPEDLRLTAAPRRRRLVRPVGAHRLHAAQPAPRRRHRRRSLRIQPPDPRLATGRRETSRRPGRNVASSLNVITPVRRAVPPRTLPPPPQRAVQRNHANPMTSRMSPFGPDPNRPGRGPLIGR